MKKVLLATSALVAFAGVATAQEVSLGGEVEFTYAIGETADDHDQDFEDLDFGTETELKVSYSNSTKAGLEYGANVEIDGKASDGATGVDALPTDGISFDDVYIFVNSALGNVKMGETEGVDLTEVSAGDLEAENIRYSTSVMGADVVAAFDDELNWAAGASYSVATGLGDVTANVEFTENALAADASVSVGGVSLMPYMSSNDNDDEVLGIIAGYDLAGIALEAGYEVATDGASGDEDESAYLEAEYTLAEGLTWTNEISLDGTDPAISGNIKVAF